MLSKLLRRSAPRLGDSGRRTGGISIPRLIRLFAYLCVFAVLLMFVLEFRPVVSTLLNVMPDIVSRVRHPISISAEQVTRLHRLHGLEPPSGHQFVAVDLTITCQFKVAYPLVRECFQLVDSQDEKHLPHSNSPLLVEHGGEFGEFYMDTNDVVEGQFVFTIREERSAEYMRFDRAKEREKEIREAVEEKP